MTRRIRAPKKEIFGWAMFDFANQAYTLLIITVVFGDLFIRVIIVGDEPDHRLDNLFWSLSLAIGYLGMMILSSIAGAVMDYPANKKRFLFASYVVTVISATALHFVAPGYAWLGVLLLIVSNFAYSIGEAFIAAFPMRQRELSLALEERALT